MLFYLWWALKRSHYESVAKVKHFYGIRSVFTVQCNCLSPALSNERAETVHAKWRQWLLLLLTSVLSGQDQSDMSGDKTVCISVGRSPQASFSCVMAASSVWKQAGERLWGISCQYRDAQLISLCHQSVTCNWKVHNTRLNIFAFLKHISCICDESFAHSWRSYEKA